MPQESHSFKYAKVARETPSCPSCGLAFKNIKLTECIRCDFSLGKTDLIFPYDPPPMEPFMDHLNSFTEEQIMAIMSEFSPLTKKYPQIKIALCNLNLISTTDPRVFGFWMLNRSPLGEGETGDDRANTILIVIDRENLRLSASVGLAIEPYLPTSDLSRALERSYRHWIYNDPTDGAAIFANELSDILTSSIQHLNRP